MPTYQYTCPNCKHTEQKMHKISETPCTACPVCMKANVVRGVGGGLGFHLSGEGYYATDYKYR